MKRFRVRISAAAHKDLRAAYQFIRQNSPANAARWREELLQTCRSLESFPHRCPLAREARSFETEVRQLLYGNYRILFTIEERAVVVLHIRHSARQYMAPDDLSPPDLN